MNHGLFKCKVVHRARIAHREEHKHDTKRAGPAVDVKRRRKYLKYNPISDAMFCDDLSYVPFRYIRGTLQLPGVEPTSEGYVAQ